MQPSRRSFFACLAACGVTESLLGCSREAAPQRAWPAHLVDLTHTLSPNFPFIPIQNKTFPFRLTPIATLGEDGVYANRWELTEHVGTHLDAPSHFAQGGISVDEIALTSLLAPLVVLNISERARTDADASVEVEDLLDWERRYGKIPPRAALVMSSGWATRAYEPGRFVNMDNGGTMHFPGFSARLIDFAVRERAIAGVGVDTLSIDPGSQATYPAHKRLFSAGKWAVECLANLDRVPQSGASLLVAPVKVKGASGAPARVIAFW
jgi:kynurenine formamidase